MFKLQAMKGKVAGSVLGVALVVSLAAMGFVVPAFADTADSDVSLKSAPLTDPIKDTDYDLDLPSGGIMGTVDPTTGAITYNTITGKTYSAGINNNTVLPLKVAALDVVGATGFNLVTSTALPTATAANALASTITPDGGTAAVEIADAEATTVNPAGIGWDNIAGNTDQGYVFGNGGVKNLSTVLSDTTGLLAYTVTWTVAFA